MEQYDEATGEAAAVKRQDHRQHAAVQGRPVQPRYRPTVSSSRCVVANYKERQVGFLDVLLSTQQLRPARDAGRRHAAFRRQGRRTGHRLIKPTKQSHHQPAPLAAARQGVGQEARRQQRAPRRSDSALSVSTSSSGMSERSQGADQHQGAAGRSCSGRCRGGCRRAASTPHRHGAIRSTPGGPGHPEVVASPSGTSACPTSGAAPARAASTAPASPCTATRRSASACRTAPPTSSSAATGAARLPAARRPGLLRRRQLQLPRRHLRRRRQMIAAPHTGAVVCYCSIARRLDRRPVLAGARSAGDLGRPPLRGARPCRRFARARRRPFC